MAYHHDADLDEVEGDSETEDPIGFVGCSIKAKYQGEMDSPLP